MDQQVIDAFWAGVCSGIIITVASIFVIDRWKRRRAA
jgi:hypothetical protein